MKSDYGSVADEYYNSVLHPTCADFYLASSALLGDFFRDNPRHGLIFEVGAGKSALPSILKGKTGNRIILSDSSPEMLSHSRRHSEEAAEFILCDASELPEDLPAIDLIVASLGDPYNSHEFWREVSRVLRVGGEVYFTTPSWEWAHAFRSGGQEERPGYALFVTASGGRLYLRSDIRPEPEQRKMMAEVGLEVRQTVHFTLADLKRQRVQPSSKLSGFVTDNTPIVTAFSAVKRS